MKAFRDELKAAMSVIHNLATEWLGKHYEVTVVLHTDNAKPSQSVVASTGEQVNALPALTDASTDQKEME